MTRVYAIVDEVGNILDEVVVNETDEHGNSIPVLRNYIPPNYTKRLFVPKWNFENKEWIEGLTPVEVEERKIEIENMNNKISGEEMNAIAIMELAQIIMGSD